MAVTVNTGVNQRHLNGNRDKQQAVLEGQVPVFSGYVAGTCDSRPRE